jgi:hypothetical protein
VQRRAGNPTQSVGGKGPVGCSTRPAAYLDGMSARSILAAASLLFVLQAPNPGELAGEPADASAEIVVSRATACSGLRDVVASPPSGLAATAPHLEVAFHVGVEAPRWTRSAGAPRADRVCAPLASRPPPAS